MRLRPGRLAGGVLFAVVGSTAWVMVRRKGAVSVTPPPVSTLPPVAELPQAPDVRQRSTLWQQGRFAFLAILFYLLYLVVVAVTFQIGLRRLTPFVLPAGVVAMLGMLLACIFVLPR
jgi:hypothetical protein